ncbi:MAG: hypothetical protein WC600_01735 [Desulfobaccales bacterium]
MTKIQQYAGHDDLKKAQKLFSKGVPLYGDWVYERSYPDIVLDDLTDIIPNDVEDTLLLLRLFKVGDLVFTNHCITEQDEPMFRQLPYRVMADIRPFQKYELENEECSEFDKFSSEMMSQNNWDSAWFQTARRFFLYGSSKYFNSIKNEVDRIVDYMIVMESILVTENNFVGRRLRERAASLLKNPDIYDNGIKSLLRDFYKVRSKIVHGDDISSFKDSIRDKQIINKFESIVREIIKEAIKSVPEGEENRKVFLKRLFDVCDGDRATKVYQDFCAIKDATEKNRCFDSISKHL